MGKPCGYPVNIFKEVDPKFLCVYCQLVLRNPFQSYCGHRFCKDCIDYVIGHESSRLCPTCVAEGGDSEYSSLTTEQTFPDNAIKREFNSMKADCPFSGCKWSGTFKDFEAHYISCEYRELECECGAKYPHNRQGHHLQNECPLREVNCLYCDARAVFKELDEHYKRCPSYPIMCATCDQTIPRNGFQLHELEHGDVSGGSCIVCSKTILEENLDQHLQNDLAGHLTVLAQRMDRLDTVVGLTPSPSSSNESLVKRIETLENKSKLIVSKQLQTPETQSAAVASPGGASALSVIDPKNRASPAIIIDMQNKMEICENVLTVLNREAEKLTLRLDSTERQRRSEREQLDAMDRKVKALERMLALKDASISELDLRITALEQTSYDGTLLWRISDFARKRQEAISGRTTSIYSPAFYTNKTGYKMCSRLYLNGDGMGKGTHVSLFFVVMRGQYDALLKWPFRQKVTLMFLEQSGKEHIVDAFRPDPTSSSFKRPTTEMNIASGCPLFMAISLLESPVHAFVKDNTAFLKIVVSGESLS